MENQQIMPVVPYKVKTHKHINEINQRWKKGKTTIFAMP